MRRRTNARLRWRVHTGHLGLWSPEVQAMCDGAPSRRRTIGIDANVTQGTDWVRQCEASGSTSNALEALVNTAHRIGDGECW